ncbi:MAG: hypothetical protein K2P73_21085 [Lachnospiraceae bacterium]|nr:hypothetical protein [Lachnospiraceae bacterium]
MKVYSIQMKRTAILTNVAREPVVNSEDLYQAPHMSWASIESRTHLITETVRNIEAFLDGTDRNVINP